MDVQTIGIVAAGLGVIATIIIIWFLIKGVRSLGDIRDFLGRPPHDRQ
ncbi:MAG: hypothetical protein WBZ45_10775 [Acidimicrobiia bacterium]